MGGVKNDIKKGFTGSPDLQDVTDVGNTSTNEIIVDKADAYQFIAKSNGIEGIKVYVSDGDNESYVEAVSTTTPSVKTLYTQSGQSVRNGSDFTNYGIDKITINLVDYPFPNGVSSQIATLADLPQIESDFLDDTAAATGGIPVGGLYHTSGIVKIRLV